MIFRSHADRVIGRQLLSEVRSLPSFGSSDKHDCLCDLVSSPVLSAKFQESNRRSTKGFAKTLYYEYGMSSKPRAESLQVLRVSLSSSTVSGLPREALTSLSSFGQLLKNCSENCSS